jgi:SRSO17 transposase
LTPEARARAKIPTTVRFQEKWRLALTLLRQARAAGFQITAVLGDAEFGDNRTLRQYLHRSGLAYALGVSSTLTVSCAGGAQIASVRALAAQLPRRAWRVISWRNGANRPWKAHFAAVRATPVARWPHRQAPEIWVLFERDLGTTPRVKTYFVALPPTASLRALVRLAHHRWAIEQQYQELKDELGLDHFEGRSWPGWNRHVLLTALAYTWLQHERRRAGARLPTLPIARAVITEVLTAHLFVTHPHYLETMMKLKNFHLRI